MPKELVFVPTDDSAKIQHSERQLIRSYCMRQKNRRPDSRRSRREAARATAANECRPNGPNQQCISGSDAIHKDYQIVGQSKSVVEWRREQAFNDKSSISRPPPSDWALFRFAEELDHTSQKLMHQYFIRNPIRDPLCPFQLFGIPVHFDQDPSWCFRLLTSEKLCLRAVLLLNSASHDLTLQRPLSSVTRNHLRRTLSILSNRLSDMDAYKSDTVLYVISIMATISILFGEYNAARVHGVGLSQIIRLRGGLGAIDHIPVIQLSMDRLNFSSLLVTDDWTSIHEGFVWNEPVFTVDITDLYHQQGMVNIHGSVNPNLAVVFRNLQYTTILLNECYHNKAPVNGVLLQECLGFIHSRILDLEGKMHDQLSECLLQGMMAILATTFRHPGLHKTHYCRSLATKLQRLCTAIQGSALDLHESIYTWLTFVCLICSEESTVNESIWTSLRPMLAQGSWTMLRERLKVVLWIDAFHDDLGKRVFEALRIDERDKSIKDTLR